MNASSGKLSKSIRSSFTHKEEILLIELVKKNSRLYDGSCSSRNEKSELWKKISAVLSKTGKDYMCSNDTSILFGKKKMGVN